MRAERTGIVILYKDTDWTSFDAVAKARGILATRKVGHSGTLDPMATGVLPLFLGMATKAVDMQIDKDKEYIACFLLGKNTDTGDITGEVINSREVHSSKEDVVKALESFKGLITQFPPMYSAVKVNGQPLYKLARQGLTVDRKPRQVNVYSIEMLSDETLAENEYKVRILCSEGTYIRSIVEDLGEKLGCGAVLTKLVRTRACGYTLDEALTLAELQKHRDDDTIDSIIRPVDSLFMHMDRIDISKDLAVRLLNGARSRISKPDGQYRVYYHDRFFGIARIEAKKMRAVKMFVSKETEVI